VVTAHRINEVTPPEQLAESQFSGRRIEVVDYFDLGRRALQRALDDKRAAPRLDKTEQIECRPGNQPLSRVNLVWHR